MSRNRRHRRTTDSAAGQRTMRDFVSRDGARSQVEIINVEDDEIEEINTPISMLRLSRRYKNTRYRPTTLKEAMKANIYFAPAGFDLTAYTSLIIRMFEKYRRKLHLAQAKVKTRVPWGSPVVPGDREGDTLDLKLPGKTLPSTGTRGLAFVRETQRGATNMDAKSELDFDISDRRRTLRSSYNQGKQTTASTSTSSATSATVPPYKVDSDSNDEEVIRPPKRRSVLRPVIDDDSTDDAAERKQKKSREDFREACSSSVPAPGTESKVYRTLSGQKVALKKVVVVLKKLQVYKQKKMLPREATKRRVKRNLDFKKNSRPSGSLDQYCSSRSFDQGVRRPSMNTRAALRTDSESEESGYEKVKEESSSEVCSHKKKRPKWTRGSSIGGNAPKIGGDHISLNMTEESEDDNTTGKVSKEKERKQMSSRTKEVESNSDTSDNGLMVQYAAQHVSLQKKEPKQLQTEEIDENEIALALLGNHSKKWLPGDSDSEDSEAEEELLTAMRRRNCCAQEKNHKGTFLP